jgi:FMN phosphatase YigB (HAD superfamily)
MSYLICDLGNVLLDTYCSDEFLLKKYYKVYERPIHRYEYFPEAEFKSFKKIYKQYERFDYCGLVKLKDYMNKYQSDVWDLTIKPNEKMVNWIREIKNKGVQIAYLSNMGWDHFNLLKEKYSDFINLADVKFMSCEVGAAKPDFVYYKTFLDMYPQYNGAIYLDDRQENLNVGSMFGLKSFYFNLEDNTLDIDNLINNFERLLDIHNIE